MSKTKQEYNITTFEPEFTDIEILLRRELEQNLPDNVKSYATEEQLQQLKEYRSTSETFHPENHFYAFQADELVGFIHAWPQENQTEFASVSVPYVKPSHREAEEQLFIAVIEKMKEHGIEALRVSANPRDSVAIGIAKRLGYEEAGIERLVAHTKLDQLDASESDLIDVVPFNLEEHGDIVLDMYEKNGHNRKQIEQQFKWISEMEDRVISWNMAKLNNEYVGHSVGFVYEGDNVHRAQVNAVTLDNPNDKELQIIETLYAKHFEAARAQPGIDEIDLYLISDRTMQLRQIYEVLGFTFNEYKRYEYPI